MLESDVGPNDTKILVIFAALSRVTWSAGSQIALMRSGTVIP
jgi:hypothetical protein